MLALRLATPTMEVHFVLFYNTFFQQVFFFSIHSPISKIILKKGGSSRFKKILDALKGRSTREQEAALSELGQVSKSLHEFKMFIRCLCIFLFICSLIDFIHLFIFEKLLLMGNEETLGGFRPDQFVAVLV